jgi:hypothetical protein
MPKDKSTSKSEATGFISNKKEDDDEELNFTRMRKFGKSDFKSQFWEFHE